MRNGSLWRMAVIAVAVVSSLTAAADAARADEPSARTVDGNGAKYSPVDSAGEPGSQAKRALAAAYEEYAATGVWDATSLLLPDSPEPPPAYRVLNTHAREQNNGYFCGPAAGQVVINWSRGYTSSVLDGENASTNYETQSDIADVMETTNPDGTDGAGVKRGVNQFAQMPNPDWKYYYQSPADGAEFYSWIVADVAGSDMPLIPGVKPFKPDQTNPKYHLPNWNSETTVKHWIVIRGFAGTWDGTDEPQVYYNESASNHVPGQHVTGALTMWKVTSFLWGGTVVW